MKSDRIKCVCAKCGTDYEKRRDRVLSPDYCGQECRTNALRQARLRKCAFCSKEYYSRPNLIRSGSGTYCGTKCAGGAAVGRVVSEETRQKMSASLKGKPGLVGQNNPNYKGRWKDKQGYVYLRISRKVKSEHRYVAEKMLGRNLTPNEVVHHKNRDRSDNRPENLEVMTRAEHMAEHAADRPKPKHKQGESNPASKLVEAQIDAIRNSGETNVALARRYGVTETLISMVRLRKIWRHVA